MNLKETPPLSCTRWTDPVLITVVAAAVYGFCRDLSLNNAGLACLVIISVTLVMGAVEIFYAPWRKMPRPKLSFAEILKNAGVRGAGLLAGFGLTLLFWRLWPDYNARGFSMFPRVVYALLPYVPVVTGACVLFTEWRLGPAEDDTWHLGMLALGRWKKAKPAAAVQALLGWAVRAMFLPLNFMALITFIGRFRGNEHKILDAPWQEAEYYLITMLSGLLAAAIVPGYLFSSRLLGTHIRKVDATLAGWLATLSCYPPLLAIVFTQGLNFYPYMERVRWAAPWATELADFPPAAMAAGAMVLLLEAVHYWGEAAFGLRASNLSNRGIITNGPFRFCKHPIYLVKCVIWFLWMPFLAGDTVLQNIYLTLMWAGTCAIYGARAWVEERLLSDDPQYVDYALWMDRHGMFAWAGHFCPFLRFEWRLTRWSAKSM